MPIKKNTLLKLSFHDLKYLACEEVFPAMTNFVTCRFKTKHSVEEIRNAVRYMLTIYPRLRSIIEPTLFSYKLRILEDNDRRLDVYFNDSFRVKYNLLHDSKEHLEYRRTILNDSFSLEQGLPIKIRYLPDDPNPILYLSIQHVVGDGMSLIHIVNSLLLYLNGNKPPVVPLDDPNLLPTMAKRPYKTLFQQTARSFKVFREDLRKRNFVTINPSLRPSDYFGPVDMHQHVLSFSYTDIKSKSKSLRCSYTVLILAAFSMAICRRQKKDRRGSIVWVNFGVNLRPFYEGKHPVFGNYALQIPLIAHNKHMGNPHQMINEIKEQAKLITSRLKGKEYLFPMLLEKLLTMGGKKYFAMFFRMAKPKGLMPMSYAFTSGGILDKLNSHGTKAQVCSVSSIVPQHGLFFTIAIIDGKINTNISFPEAEYTRDDILDLIQSFEHELGNLLEL